MPSPPRSSRLSPAAQRRESQRLLMIRRRRLARQKGLCSRCLARPALPSRRSCQECLDRRHESGG